MKSTIKKFDSGIEYFFKEGCYINELSNSVEDEQVSIAKARVKPKVRTKWHSLNNTVERYVILEGMGEVEIGDSPPVQVSKGDVVIIPAKSRQRILNIGNSDLVFLAICSPRFKEANYVALE